MILGADVIRYLLSAGGAVLIFLLVALWIHFAGRASAVESVATRRARRVLLVCAVAFALMSSFGLQVLVARALVGSLRTFQAGDAVPGRRTAVVILGSGSWDTEDWEGRVFAFADKAAASRVLEAVRVFKLIDPAVVISSGGNPHPQKRMVPGGETMRDLLVALGVPADCITVETASATTRDEAVIVASMLQAQRIEQVVLVTGETHMRRALGTFRAVGVTSIPAIAMDYARDSKPWPSILLPQEDGLVFASANAHELVGFTYYWLRGWWTSQQVGQGGQTIGH